MKTFIAKLEPVGGCTEYGQTRYISFFADSKILAQDHANTVASNRKMRAIGVKMFAKEEVVEDKMGKLVVDYVTLLRQ